MATKNHTGVRRARRYRHRVLRTVLSEWAVVVPAHTVAVLALMVLEQDLRISPCAC
jgi:hypothetical protein